MGSTPGIFFEIFPYFSLNIWQQFFFSWFLFPDFKTNYEVLFIMIAILQGWVKTVDVYQFKPTVYQFFQKNEILLDLALFLYIHQSYYVNKLEDFKIKKTFPLTTKMPLSPPLNAAFWPFPQTLVWAFPCLLQCKTNLPSVSEI